MPWKKVTGEIKKMRKKTKWTRRIDRQKLFKDLIENLECGEEYTMKLNEFKNEYGINLSGLSEKIIIKRIRSALRAAVKKGILDEFHTFGDIITVKRSNIPKEELLSELGEIEEEEIEEEVEERVSRRERFKELEE